VLRGYTLCGVCVCVCVCVCMCVCVCVFAYLCVCELIMHNYLSVVESITQFELVCVCF